MIRNLHAFCCQLAPSVWFWELWHSGLCEWNSNNVIVDVTDTPDDAGTVWKSGPRHTVWHGVIWSARKHDKNSFRKTVPSTRRRDSLIHLIARSRYGSIKLLRLNWIAGCRAWRVKDNSSRARLAGCQRTVQSRPRRSAAGWAHTGVLIRRDSLRCFDGSVIAARVCYQLGLSYQTATCYHPTVGSQSRLASEGQETHTD